MSAVPKTAVRPRSPVSKLTAQGQGTIEAKFQSVWVRADVELHARVQRPLVLHPQDANARSRRSRSAASPATRFD